ncbi:MAG TPA: hypothetical protein VFF31_05170 [Blastocatellia bacterium]|nr:hypothetical protein [Blastocatellia bacterium]
MTPHFSKRDWFWLLFFAIGIWLFGVFVKFPQGILSSDHFPRLEYYLKLCADPLARDIDPMLAYRITVPTIAWALKLSPTMCTLLPIVFLIAAYGVLLFVIWKRTGDGRFSIMIVAGLSLTFFAHWTNRWLGYPDSFSHLCSALGLLSSNPLILALICILGTLNDERWVFSVPFLLYWHGSSHAKAGIINWIDATRAGAGLGIGILCVLLVRHALTVGWLGPGVIEPDVYKIMRSSLLDRFRPYNSTWFLFGLNIFMGFGWYWVAGIRFIKLQLLSSCSRLWGVFLALSVFATSLLTIAVEDVSRSVAFLYLIIIIASIFDYDAGSVEARKWWRLLLIAGALTPTIYYTGVSGAVFIPLPIDLANQMLQQHGWPDYLSMLKVWFRLH